MAEPNNKRIRLQRLRDRLPYVSQTALAALLQVAATDDLPSSCSRRTIGRARDSCTQVATPYGSLHSHMSLPNASGNTTQFEVQNPFAMLYHVAKSSPCVSDMLIAASSRSPPSVASPWTLVLYGDEILPGNQLSYRGDRKFWGFYWTIAQLGSAALSDEAWLRLQAAV